MKKEANTNTGHYNTGHYNSGDCNSGDFNSGHCNSGDFNSGHYNSGYFNSCNNSSGAFNTKKERMIIFNKQSDIIYDDFVKLRPVRIIFENLILNKFIHLSEMTDEEKKEHKEYKITNGYLKRYEYKEAWKNMWDIISEEEKNIIITEMPNFDKDIFFEITGIKID